MMSSGSKAALTDGHPSMSSSRDAGWSIVVPFKGGPNGKSRLQGRLGPELLGPGLRRELALGFLRDTVAAVAAAANVTNIFIVSSDPAATIDNQKVRLLPDPMQGLNRAVEAGLAYARSFGDVPVAALAADLPCLLAQDLEHALEVAGRYPLGIVPDRQGTGTTLISALPDVHVQPRFGSQSCNAHLRAGHRLLPIPRRSTLRDDVDTLKDLIAAIQRGVGANTLEVLLSSSRYALSLATGGEMPEPYPLGHTTMRRKSCPVF